MKVLARRWPSIPGTYIGNCKKSSAVPPLSLRQKKDVSLRSEFSLIMTGPILYCCTSLLIDYRAKIIDLQQQHYYTGRGMFGFLSLQMRWCELLSYQLLSYLVRTAVVLVEFMVLMH